MFADAPAVIAALALAVSIAAQDPGPKPARDTRPVQPTGTSEVAGRVVGVEETPQPVRRARVVVTNADGDVERAVVTDDEGRFVVSALPAGRYTVNATKAGSLRAAYGAVRPGRPGTSFALAAGQRATDLVLTMAKGGVIAGAITDAAGRPAVGATVKIVQYRYENGARALVPATAAGGATSDVTDDRGEYRLFGLAPGEYVVCVAADDPANGALRIAGGGTAGYVPVCYPGTTRPMEARMVAVAAGEEASGINFAIEYVPTARIDGSIVAPETFPMKDVRVTLMPESRAPIAPGPASTANVVASLRLLRMVGPDRAFSFDGIPPGRYTILAQGIERAAATPNQSFASVVSGTTALWASADLMIDGANVSGVTLVMQPGLTVSGRVSFDAAAAAMKPPPDATRVRLSLNSVLRTDGGIAMGWPTATVNTSGEFTIAGVVPGAYRVSTSYANDLANGWSAASATIAGRDVLDFPLVIAADDNLSGLTVTFTRAAQSVAGVLQDAGGRPTPGLTVVLFPADRTYWSAGRRIRTARSGQDGRYTISGIPSGDYRLAAVTDLEPGEASNPEFLEKLLPGAMPIALQSGERKIQNVRIGPAGLEPGR